MQFDFRRLFFKRGVNVMHQQMYVSCSRFTNPFWYGCNSSIVWKPILVCYGLFQYDLDGGGRVK